MIGVMGGTFDPVHFGHLRPALEVLQNNRLEHIRFIPNKRPPHREKPWLRVEQRLELLQVAVDAQAGFELDQRELEREGSSYMVDTLESLHADFTGESFCLILGMDAFLELKQWHQWQRLAELCHLIVTTRPGFEIDRAYTEQLPFELSSSVTELSWQASGRILIQSVTQLDISASQIRQLLQQGYSARYLMPDEVHERLMMMVKT